MSSADVPNGFEPHQRRSPLTDSWQPLYSRSTDDAVVLGLHIAEQHCNSRGFAHGGLISALADNAMGLSCARALDGRAAPITVNLGVDFMAAARIGQWLEFTTAFVRPGSTLCFAQAFVTADGDVCARASAVFRVTR